jgi:hypothetical protein
VLSVTIYGVWIGELIYWQLIHTSRDCNYSAIANLHIYKSPQHLLSPFPACCIFISLSLATASNNGNSSASRAQVSSSDPPVQNSTLNWLVLPGWRPFHTILLDFSSHTNFRLTAPWIRVRVRVILRLAVYRQSVHFGVRALETHDQRFLQLNSCGSSPWVTSSPTRRCVCLLRICLAFLQVYISHYNMLLKIFHFALCISPLSVRALQSRSSFSYVLPIFKISPGHGLYRKHPRFHCCGLTAAGV